jgi:hypothetical protein
MSVEIPVELMQPTIEELEERTSRDLEVNWKPCKRPGKRERNIIKQKKDVGNSCSANPKKHVLSSVLRVSLEKSGRGWPPKANSL